VTQGNAGHGIQPTVLVLDTLPLIILNDPPWSWTLDFQNRWSTKQFASNTLHYSQTNIIQYSASRGTENYIAFVVLCRSNEQKSICLWGNVLIFVMKKNSGLFVVTSQEYKNLVPVAITALQCVPPALNYFRIKTAVSTRRSACWRHSWRSCGNCHQSSNATYSGIPVLEKVLCSWIRKPKLRN
jgi:hypothetical protein